MQQEAHQEIIRQSVAIDRDLGRAVAKLPFVQDPVNKLTNNTRLATKRLEKPKKMGVRNGRFWSKLKFFETNQMPLISLFLKIQG